MTEPEKGMRVFIAGGTPMSLIDSLPKEIVVNYLKSIELGDVNTKLEKFKWSNSDTRKAILVRLNND